MTAQHSDDVISTPDSGNPFSKYEDMLFLPHHESPAHPHMSMHDRAAQFVPFEALGELEDNSGGD
jgi:hypothetical protein